MAPRYPDDPTQPNWLDLIRAMAWAPPNLPLFSSQSSATNGAPLDGANRGGPDATGAGEASSSQWLDSANLENAPAYAPGFDLAAGPRQWPVDVSAQSYALASGLPPWTQPPMPRRRPPNAPQLPPVGMSQASPWSPNVSGFTPAEAPPAFDPRWSGSPLPPSLLDMSNVASPISQQYATLSAAGTVDPRYLFSYLLNKGFSIPQSAALVGNMIEETHLDPSLVNTRENAHGLLQWRLDRWPNLQEFAAARGTSPNDVNTQLDFIVHEMRGSEASNARDFLLANDVQSANAALKRYVRYGSDTEASRLNNALNVLGLPWKGAR